MPKEIKAYSCEFCTLINTEIKFIEYHEKSMHLPQLFTKRVGEAYKEIKHSGVCANKAREQLKRKYHPKVLDAAVEIWDKEIKPTFRGDKE